MDFLKKKMKELLDDDEKKPEKKPEGDKVKDSHAAPGGAQEGQRGASDSFYNQGAPQGGPPHGGPPPGQHQQYPPQGPPQGQYGQYPPQQQGYPPQQHGYPQQQPYGQQPYGQGGPPPVGPAAPMGAPPPMPPGWIQQWDQNSQRWYYVEQATGRTQWDPPSNLPPGPYAPPPAGAPYVPPAGHDERGLFGNTGGHQGHDYTKSGAATNEKEKDKDKKKDKGHSTAMLAAAGIGGVAAGAWIGHELTEDDNKSSSHGGYGAPMAAAPMAAGGAYGAAPGGYGDPYGAQSGYPPPVPTHDADGSSISSSDRESLEEKRQEMIEAQEEYQEELDDAYDS